MESAVYARQSVEKKNSLSIEGQIDLCEKTAGKKLQVYKDRGFSGKNTHRPDFQRLMKDICAGRIDKLYVYRLDRFSRSVADFGSLWEVLRSHNVEFVSISENFDTSTPMGRAMLHIIMVFAQLERETTAERVKDNYYKRASLGSWPGGPAPYGYTIGRSPDRTGRSVPTLLIDPAQEAIVQRIFEQYAWEEESLGSVARTLNAEGIAAPKRETWDNVAVSRILHCPVYVKADEQVRLHYQGLGASVTSPPEDFDGIHGLLLVGKRDKAQKKYTDVHSHTVSVMNSMGFIPSELWLVCQNKLQKNHQLGNTGKGTHTWLSGLMKCGSCGYSLKVASTKYGRYLNCSGRYNLYKCREDIQIDLTELEQIAAEKIQAMLDECPDKPISMPTNDDYAVKLDELERKAERLINAFAESTDVTASYLLRALEQIETERKKLLEERARENSRGIVPDKLDFSKLIFEEKKAVASNLIQRIVVSGDQAEIIWRV